MWDEQDSKEFIDYGRFFVPGREIQIEIMRDLIPPRSDPFLVLELACGQGLLSEAILERFTHATVHGYDGSEEMLRQAKERLARFGYRFMAQTFDLADRSWRNPSWPIHAVVSSLAIHHLDGEQKRELFGDVYQMLSKGGVLLIADIIQPASETGLNIAAEAWDRAVRQRSLEIGGNLDAFEHFNRSQWNLYRFPDPVDKPSGLFEQLRWLEESGFGDIDVFWLEAGHAIFGGRKG